MVESVARIADFTGGKTCVGEAPMERNLNRIFEIELNFIGSQRIGESIERLLRCGFDTFGNIDDPVNLRFIDCTLRSVDKQPNVFVKL